MTTRLRMTAFGQTQRNFGGGPWRFLTDLIEIDLPDFGPAVRQIWLTIYCNGALNEPSRGFPPLNETPSTIFRRKKAELKIVFPSTRFTPDQAQEYYLNKVTLGDLALAKVEVEEALKWGLGRTVKKADDFDGAGLLHWLSAWEALKHASSEDLRAQWIVANEERKRRLELADPWTLLDVDWGKMHANARVLLDRPEDWSSSDDFSPHGNDTGADIFSDWAAYSRLSPKLTALRMGWDPDQPGMKEVMWCDWFELHLALAFGHIKRKGACPANLADATIHLLDDPARMEELIVADNVERWRDRMARYRRILLLASV